MCINRDVVTGAGFGRGVALVTSYPGTNQTEDYHEVLQLLLLESRDTRLMMIFSQSQNNSTPNQIMI